MHRKAPWRVRTKGQGLSYFVTRVLCGSGQQHPLRAPHRVQRIAFEIVSSGVCMSSRCRCASSCGSIINAVPAIVAVQPGTLAEPDKHRQVGLLPGVVFRDMVLAHAGILARFAADAKLPGCGRREGARG